MIPLRLSSWKRLSVAGVLVAALVKPDQSLAFPSTSAFRLPGPLAPLHVTTKKVVFDGPEWASIQQILRVPKQSGADSLGLMTVVVGTREDTGDRIVGVVSSSGAVQDEMPTFSLKENKGIQVYQHSAAKVGNNKIQDREAMNTLIAALTGVHCTAPRVEGVGGATNSELISGKVVILGGSDYACFAAEGLAALGSQVTLVSTNNKLNVKNPSGTYVLASTM
jgi:Pyridine nucleotide-disulphide oxidoreductase